jgi:hypothetical protein
MCRRQLSLEGARAQSEIGAAIEVSLVNNRSDSKFAARIAAINAIGYGGTVAVATYVDAHIPSHFRYGARTYEYGYPITFLAIPVLVLTYLGFKRARTRAWRCFSAWFPLAAATVLSLWVFAPEIPHAGVVGWATMYAAVSLSATWLRYSPPDLQFVRDTGIPVQVRMEGLKSVQTLWQTITLATFAGYFALLVPWFNALITGNTHVVKTQQDLFLLNSFANIQMGAVSLAVILAPVRELIARVMNIAATFAVIREPIGNTGRMAGADTEAMHRE